MIGLMLGIAGPALTGLLAVWFVLGAGASLVQTPAGRLLRRSAQEGDRPAIVSVQFALSDACWLVAYPLAGWSGATLGLATIFAILAILALAATASAAMLWPASDAVEMEHMHEAMAHEHLHFHDAHHQHEHEGWEGPELRHHPHRQEPLKHKHAFVIDLHHPV